MLDSITLLGSSDGSNAGDAGLIANRTYSPGEVKGVLRSAALLCGMRLHPAIFASSELTPVVALAYMPKVRYYFESLGMEEYCLSFDDFSAAALEALVLRGWAGRKAMRDRLAARIPVLRGRALVAAEMVAALGRGEDIDDILTRARARDRAGAEIVEAALQPGAEAA